MLGKSAQKVEFFRLKDPLCKANCFLTTSDDTSDPAVGVFSIMKLTNPTRTEDTDHAGFHDSG